MANLSPGAELALVDLFGTVRNTHRTSEALKDSWDATLSAVHPSCWHFLWLVPSFGVPRSNPFFPLMPGRLSPLRSCSAERTLGKVSYSCVTRRSLAPELGWVFALVLPFDEVALVNVQYAMKLLCKIPLNWARHSCCLSEGDFHCWVWGSDSMQVILEY